MKYCTDPLKYHKIKVHKYIRPISRDLFEKCKGLIPQDTLLCTNCIRRLNKSPELLEDTNISDSGSTSESAVTCEEMAVKYDTEKMNSALTALDVTPIKKHSLTVGKKKKKSQEVLQKAHASLKRKLQSSFSIEVSTPKKVTKRETLEREVKLKKIMEELVSAFEMTESQERRIQLLSVSPYSIRKTYKIFGTTLYMVRKAKDLKKKYGILPKVPHVSKGKVVTPEMREQIQLFFQSDDISRLCSGKKDCLSIQNKSGEKVTMQKRLMLMNLRECFVEYKKDASRPQVGFSTFANCRPQYCILAGSSGTHSICVCIYHQNPKLQIAALGYKELNYKLLILKCVCNPDNRNCMMQLCNKCPGKRGVEKYLQELLESNDNHYENINYKQWVSTDRCTLENKSETISDFITSLGNKIYILTRHHFVSQQQSKFLKNLQDNLLPSEILVLGDFSENYSFIVQDSIQGFHWENTQCTVHPFVVYWKANDEVKHQSYCALSPNTKHSTTMVYSLLQLLIAEIKTLLPQTKLINYFTDGCVSQYKNCYNFINIAHHEEDFGIKAIWHFFGTAHGKNVCDGIGGTVKRTTARASLQRPLNNQILTAKDMFEFCKTTLKSIKFLYLANEDIEFCSNFLKERYEMCKTICGTKKFHKFCPVSKEEIEVFELSTDAHGTKKFIINKKKEILVQKSDLCIDIGTYIVCLYMKRKWIGIITSYSEEFDDYIVNFMHPSGYSKYYVFPSAEDSCPVPRENIIAILCNPTLKSSLTRIQYQFESRDFEKYFKDL